LVNWRENESSLGNDHSGLFHGVGVWEMGVPSFFRWLADKYPRVIKDAVVPTDEEIQGTGDVLPLDLSSPNPNGEYDNLYLDMNGLIHPACHPEDKPQPKSEDEMIENVFMYVDRIFAIVRPRKLLYMAIDGVAPRAKMNQQRSRRFKTAKEIEETSKKEQELRDQWSKEGKETPSTKTRWDHNAITPGTAFMDRLAKALRFYAHMRVSRDPAWSNIKVIFSDASVPGEGEHKLMNYIRLQRAQPGYDPNMSHVLYGMDADLIMLGLATHEVNFNIIRETVVFKTGGKCNICGKPGHFAKDCKGAVDARPEDELKTEPDSPFQFLKISILREYLLTELYVENTRFDWDGERAIDDFVFLCFFVGNDFLPHLPSLEIREGAIDDLIILYKRNLSTWDGYMTDHGNVDLAKVNLMLKELSSLEDKIFKLRKQGEERAEERRKQQERQRLQREKVEAARAKEAEETSSFNAQNQDAASRLKRKLASRNGSVLSGASKRTKLSLSDEDSDDDNEKGKSRASGHSEEQESQEVESKVADDDDADVSIPIPPVDADVTKIKAFFDELKNVVKQANTVEDVVDEVKLEVEGWKERYYEKKFYISPEHIGKRHGPVYDIAKAYIEGLCWVLLYYYNGCPSWEWYYPYHYAPFASDLYESAVLNVEFELGKPFSPLAQLMAVLPSLSGHLVPEPYRKLMCEKDSPILDFYPLNFTQDLNGKKFMWQAIALLPFIDEKRLLEALDEVRYQLTEEENDRDQPGFEYIYTGMANPLGSVISSMYLKYENVEPSKLLKKRKLLSPADSGGIFGYIAPYPDAELPGSTIECVLPTVQPIGNSRSVAAAFFDPPHRRHLCTILPSAKSPEPVLSQQDFLTVSSTKRFGGRSILRMDSYYKNNNGPGTTQYLPGYFKNRSDDRDYIVGQADLRRRNSNGNDYQRSDRDYRDRGQGRDYRGGGGGAHDYRRGSSQGYGRGDNYGRGNDDRNGYNSRNYDNSSSGHSNPYPAPSSYGSNYNAGGYPSSSHQYYGGQGQASYYPQQQQAGANQYGNYAQPSTYNYDPQYQQSQQQQPQYDNRSYSGNQQHRSGSHSNGQSGTGGGSGYYSK
jgi:5'-3' exoribonuclease 2